MAYIPDWDTLAEAQARVTACGYSISESERDICCALRDGKLHQRYRLIGVRTPYWSEVSRRAIGQPRGPSDLRDIIGWPHVPVDLSPDDIDWENSCPKRPWRDARGFIVDIDKIEVSTKDVIRILCSGPSGVSSARQHLSSKSELPEASLVNETADEPAVEAAARFHRLLGAT